jgi:hypothetical protein
MFGASDGLFTVYSIENLGPDVNCVPEALFSGVQGYMEGSAGIGHITDHTPSLNWTFNDGDSGDVQVAYNVTVWDSAKSTLLWYNSTTSPSMIDAYNGTGTAIADLVDGEDYWLNVSVFDGTVWSPWNEIQFHMNTPPPAPVPPISPSDDSMIPSSPGQTLGWTSGGLDFEADTTTYYWYVDVDNPPSAPYEANDSTAGLSSASFATSPLTDYYWYVNTTDGWEWNSTIVWNFTTSTVVNNPPEAQALTVQGFSEGSVGIAHVTDHTPDFTWSFFDPDGGDTQQGYDVHVGTSSGGSDIWASGPQPGGTSSITYAGTTALQDGIDYWLGISVFDGNTWSPWNETLFHMNSLESQNLMVQGFAEGTTGIAHISDHTPELSWSFWDAEVGDSQQEYEVRVGTTMGSSDMWSSGIQTGPITSIEYAGSQLIDGTDYWFGVQVNDSFELSDWNETMFHMNVLPEAQDLTVQGFASGTIDILRITDHNPVFSWTFDDEDMGDVQVEYNITVWDGSMTTLLWYNNVTSTSITDTFNSTGTAISGLADGEDYWLKVLLFDGVEWGEWNLTQFHMNSKPSLPALSSPADGRVGLMPGGQPLDWDTAFDAETDAVTYYWYVSEDPSFSTILESGSTTDTSRTIATTLATEYFWRVRAFDGYESSSNSTTWSFMTNRPPTLAWTAETNYEADGLHPENGDTSTLFTFKVVYTDEDNQAPQAEHPKVVILRDGEQILNESMDPSDSTDVDYTDGKSYTKTIQLSKASELYAYYFYVNDTLGEGAMTPSINAPDVSSQILKGTITGKVTDEKGIPLKDVEVRLRTDGSEKKILTDTNGNFSFENVSFGQYMIEASKSGYETETLDVNLGDTELDVGIIELKKMGDFPWWLILIVIVIFIVLLLLLFLKRKKKAEETDQEKEIESDNGIDYEETEISNDNL